MVLGGCLAHKTAVALSALSQYIRFILSLPLAASHHLSDINYLIEPYRLPRIAVVPVTKSAHDKRAPSHMGTPVHLSESQQRLERMKESKDPSVGRQHNGADGTNKIADAEAKHFPPDEKIARGGGESRQDADYDENMEVELDKEEMKFARPRDLDVEAEVRRDFMITSSNLPRILVARPAAGPKHSRADTDSIRVLFRYYWFIPVVAVFLLSFWLRCVRCVRCGFVLRLCRRFCSLTD